MSRKKTAFYAALCLFLSAIEYAIPKPLPFLRLGLANLPIILALETLAFKEMILLIFLKIIGQALISGTIFSYIFVFSAAGSIASALTMICLHRVLKKSSLVSNITYSLSGALANNLAQILCSQVLIFGDNTKYIAPLLLVSGVITGLLLGIFTNKFVESSSWYELMQKTEYQGSEPVLKQNELAVKYKKANVFFMVSCILSIVTLLLLDKVWIKWIIACTFLLVLEIKKKGKVKVFPSIIIVLSVTLFSLLDPSGKILWKCGILQITQDSLLGGLKKSANLVGMVYISQIFVSRKKSLPGKLGKFIDLVFAYFEQLTEVKLSFGKKNFISVVDNHLLSIWNYVNEQE